MPSPVLKTLKRSMTAEYRRELSVKALSGQCRFIELGFRQGAPRASACGASSSTAIRRPKGCLVEEIPHTAHYFLQLVNGILEYAPGDVLRYACAICSRGARTGYLDDSVARAEAG